jgi:signal transduction histidine kinase
VQESARRALDELRSLIFELRPPDLERDGLCGALRKHVDVVRALQPGEIQLDLEAVVEPDPGRAREILRIAQEALSNAVRHAHADHIRLRLADEDGRVVLEVRDDGAGFDPDAPEVRSRRLGLTSMEERAQRLGGRLTVASAPGGGTTVRLEAARG